MLCMLKGFIHTTVLTTVTQKFTQNDPKYYSHYACLDAQAVCNLPFTALGSVAHM